MNNFENPQSREEVYYTAGGKTKTVDSTSSFAKKIDRENGIDTYYIKYARGRVFDPWGIYQDRARSLNHSYKRVPEKIFNFYIEYLKTRNKSYLRKVERN